jgi:CheY-like chemotaxis protein/HPt (histidine-containing phosphotransfer) domain-containing protein
MHIPHIFIAESSEYNQILFAKMLDQLGYATSTAGDVQQLFELLGSTNPDMLLLDMEMPDMDGFEIIQRIRQGSTGAARNLTVVALTNNNKDMMQKKFTDAGFSDLISKPFSKQTLQDKIGIILSAPKSDISGDNTDKPASITEEPLYSLKYLQDGSDGDEEFLKMMIGMFVESTPTAIQMMYEGLNDSDWDKIRQEAHKLRSHLRYFGMIKAAVITEDIEHKSANNPDAPTLAELIGKVDLICQTCIRQLSEEFHL